MHNHQFFVPTLVKMGCKPRSLLKSEERQQDEGRRRRKGWTQIGRGAGRHGKENYMKGRRGRGDRYWDRKHEMLRKRRGIEIMRGGRKVGISEEWRRRRGQQRES